MSLLAAFRDVYLQVFFVFTPFFVLSVFLSLTQDLPDDERRRLAFKTTAAVAVVSLALLLLGKAIFFMFGITLDAFRIGAGALLFLNAISLLRGEKFAARPTSLGEIAVVPLAIPVTVGPAATGVLMVLGAEQEQWPRKLTALAAVLAAGLTLGLLLRLAASIERRLGQTGLSILSKLTALMLASLAAQMIFTGIRHFL